MSAKKRAVVNDNLNLIFYLTLPLLFFPPFFRGLFFDYEFSAARIYAALILAAYVFIRKEHIRVSRNIMDYAWVGLIAAYIISDFVALNQRAGLEWVLRYFTFAAIYLLLAYTISSYNDFKTAFSVMFAAGVGVALAGLGTAFGTFSFKGAFSENMILSTLQYHNAAAIFMVAAGVIGLYLTAALDSLGWRIAVGGLNYIVIATAYGAGSRGAMLVAPIGFLLLIAGMPKEYRFKVFVNFVSVLIPFVITAKQVLHFGVNSQGYYWGWLLIGIVLACGCQFVVEKFLGTSAEFRKRVIAGIGIAAVVVGVGLIIFLGSSIMPETIAARLSNIDLESVNVQERFYFYRDALQIIKDHPVFGVGGGGWNSVYTGYQSYLYFSTEVHNHPLQVWVESGIIGFIFYILIWVGLIITIFRIMRKVESPLFRSAAWTAAVAAITISLHSTIDFSLSLGAVAILMWACVGLVRGAERICLEENMSGVKAVAGPAVRKAVGGILAGLLLVISGTQYAAALNEQEAGIAFQSGYYQDAADNFESASSLDPINSTYHLMLAQLYVSTAFPQKDTQMITKSLEHAEKAVRLNEKAIQPMWVLAEIYLVAQRPDDAVETAEKALAGGPWKQEGYEALARIYVSAGKFYAQMGQKEKAKDVLNKATNIPHLIDQQMAKLDENARRNWVRGPLLNVSENIKKNMEQANQLKNNL